MAGVMLTILVIAACVAAGTLVHRHRHERRGWWSRAEQSL